MREIEVEKVTLNIGVGKGGQELDNAKTLLTMLSGCTAIGTKARVRNPAFKIKKGDEIGVKTTLRGKNAVDFLRKALTVRDNAVQSKSFDRNGNFSFGVAEYIEFPGAKYDPKIGTIGFDVCVTLKRKGFRVSRRKRGNARIGKGHRLTTEEGIAFAREKLGVDVQQG